MIGSHNTFSYLTPTKWWMKILTPWHKCQEHILATQLVEDNVSYIDIRVRFIDNEPVLVHNNIIYKNSVKALNTLLLNTEMYFSYLKSQNKPIKPIPYRIILDIRKSPKDALKQKKLFENLLHTLGTQTYSKYLKLDEARVFWEWDSPIVKSKYNIIEIHTSVCSKWYQYILGTKWFAKKHNKKTLELEKNNPDTIYLIDYVNIWK